MNLAQNDVLMISGTCSKLAHWGQKRDHQAKSKENVTTPGHIFEVIIMNIAQNVCFDDF